MRDSEIEQWVLHEIRLTTGGRSQEVCVLSLDGVLSLKGTVRSRADRPAIQKAAERAKGVVAVNNHLILRRKNLVRPRPSVKSQNASVSGTFHLAKHEQTRTLPAAN